jgi:hypothetical protein
MTITFAELQESLEKADDVVRQLQNILAFQECKRIDALIMKDYKQGESEELRKLTRKARKK